MLDYLPTDELRDMRPPDGFDAIARAADEAMAEVLMGAELTEYDEALEQLA